MASNLLFQALLVRYATRAARHSMRTRIVVPLVFLLLLFGATAALVLAKDVPRDGLFAFTNVCVALCGLCTSLLQAAIFGYAAVFPPSYTQAMMAGQGLAGMIVATAGLATAASSRSNDPCAGVHYGEDEAEAVCVGYEEVDYHAFAYFATAVGILAVCIASFLFLETLPFAQHYTRKLRYSSTSSSASSTMAKAGEERIEADAAVAVATTTEPSPAVPGAVLRNAVADEEEGQEETEANGTGKRRPTYAAGVLPQLDSSSRLLQQPPLQSQQPGPPHDKATTNHGATPPPFLPHDDEHHHYHHFHLSFRALLHQLGSPGAAVFLVFFVTLALFPSTTVHIVSRARCENKGEFFDQAFVPFQFLLFNVGDWGGRTLAGHLPPRFLLAPSRLAAWAAARVVFVPLFLLCNVEGSAFPVIFASDWWPTFFMVAFSLSNGYLSSLAMMSGPAQLHAAHAERGGNVMVLLMTGGLSAGSLLSFLVSAVSLGKL